MPYDQIANISISILWNVAILIIISLGLALTYGMIGVINFAHGEFMAVGAYVVLSAMRMGINVWVAIVISTIVVGLLGFIVERLLIRHLYERIVDTMLATWGLSLILNQLIVIIYGPVTSGIKTPLGNYKIGIYSVSQYSLFIIIMAILLLLATYLIFTRTNYGLMARAATQNKEMAAALGIKADRINMITFGIGSAMAGAAGALLAPIAAVMPSMGGAYIIKAFMTVIVGGQLVVSGTAASGGILGLINNFVTYLFTPVLGETAILIVAIVVLRIKRQGLSGNWRLPL